MSTTPARWPDSAYRRACCFPKWPTPITATLVIIQFRNKPRMERMKRIEFVSFVPFVAIPPQQSRRPLHQRTELDLRDQSSTSSEPRSPMPSHLDAASTAPSAGRLQEHQNANPDSAWPASLHA